MKRCVVAKFFIENHNGRAAVAGVDYTLLKGSDKVRKINGNWTPYLCNTFVYCIDLYHVGYTIISELTVSRTPAVKMSLDGKIYSISLPEIGLEVVDASEIIPGANDLLQTKKMLLHFGLAGRKGDPFTASSLARRELENNVSRETLELIDPLRMPGEAWAAAHDAYRGGLVFYREGDYQNGRTYDINSLYPWAMLQRLPVGTPTHDIPDIARNPKTWGVILCDIVATLRPGHLDWMPLVLKTSVKNGDDWNARGVWITTTDLHRLTKDYSCVIRRRDGWTWRTESGEYLFGEYIRWVYEMKRTATGVPRTCAKMLLNSVTGSFGRSDYRYSKVPFLISKEECRIGFKTVLCKWSDALKVGYMPIAAAITAIGRDRLIEDINAIGPELVVYANTDSIHCVEPVIDPPFAVCSDIGDYKIEGRWDVCRVLGYGKYYEAGENYRKVVSPAGSCPGLPFSNFHDGSMVLCERWKVIPGGKVKEIKAITI